MRPEINFAADVEMVLRRKEVTNALRAPNLGEEQLDREDLRTKLLEEEVEVRGIIEPQMQRHDEIEREISEIEERHRRLREPQGSATAIESIGGLLFLLVVAAGIGWIFGSNFLWDFIKEALTTAPITWRQIILVGALFATLVSIWERIRWYRQRLPTIDAQIAADSALENKRLELKTERDGIERRVADLIFGSASEIIGRSEAPFFQGHLLRAEAAMPDASRRMKASSAAGLSEVSDRNHEAPTIARREILDRLNELPGASIGLSGPRGSGKSTILRSLTAANLPLKGKTAVAIYSAAPVEYEARDFLLHIFATLCRQVLQTNGTTEEPAQGDLPEQQGTAELAARIVRIAPIFLWIGLIFSCVGFLLAIISRSSAFEVANTAGPGRVNLLQAIDFKAGPLLLFGISAVLTGLALKIYVGVTERAETSSPRSFLATIYRWMRPKPSHQEPEPELVTLSRRELRDIRFQRSFTEGWSGSIKVPIGFEIGRTGSASLAQRPESFPELVDRFCRYVGKVADVYGAVVIAVDELDKLKTADEAEKFINGIKSVFAISKCFYLVSVSEDALSAFERRGLSLRDAFDSAFDEIHYIGYKRLPGSRQMLARRVLRLPDPFLCLCHVLSGGLPRDLIRVARAMFDAAARSSRIPVPLREIARRLVQQEAAAKIRASRTAIRSIVLEPEVGRFASALAELELYPVGSRSWSNRLKSLEASPREGADTVTFARLISIQRELAAYLDFLSVTLMLAERLATRRGWMTAVQKQVESLALARQALESSVSVAAMRLDELRTELGKKTAAA
jgi:energy-coupling factor transporter ATP-binding protein EcfA2